jgi:DNA-binding FrmR family transcriptional regulator
MQMMALDLNKTIAQLRRELRRLIEQHKHIEMQMVNVNLALRSLVREMEDKDEQAKVLQEIAAARRKPSRLMGEISDLLRETMHSSLSAHEVRECLEKGGLNLSDYSQPLATISVTLGRLTKSRRVKATRKGRKVTYQWIGD